MDGVQIRRALCETQIIYMELTVIVLVHQFKYSVTDVFDVSCDARIVLPLDLMDDLRQTIILKREMKHLMRHLFLSKPF